MKNLLLLFIALLPSQFTLNPSSSIDLASGRVLALVLIAAWVGSSLKKRAVPVRPTLAGALLALFFLWSAFSLVGAGDGGSGLRKLVFWGTFFPLFWVVSEVLRSPHTKTRALGVLMFSTLCASLVGLAQFALQFGVGYEAVFNGWASLASFLYGSNFGESVLAYNSWLVNIGGETYFRAVSLFPDPHVFAFYLVLVIPLAFFSSRRLFKVFGVIFCAALLVTFSRAGYIGALAGCSAYALFALTRFASTHSFSRLAGYALVGICLLAIALPFRDRLFSSFSADDGSAGGRLAIWSDTLSLIREHPLRGVGLGNYAFAMEPATSFRTPFYAHNLYLDIAAELGIVGLGIWLALIIHLSIGLLTQPKKNVLASALFLSLFSFSVQSFFDTALFSVAILPLIVIFFAIADDGEELSRVAW